MDILTYFLSFVVIEAGICGICWLVCRERHVQDDVEKQPKRMSPHTTLASHRSNHGIDPQKAWSSHTEHQSHRKDRDTLMLCLSCHISSLRH